MKQLFAAIATAMLFATPALAAPPSTQQTEMVAAPWKYFPKFVAQAPRKQAKIALSSMAGTDLSEYHRHLA